MAYLYLAHDAAVWTALWVLHSWAIEAADYSPRLVIRSPTRRCGKSLLLEFLHALCRRPLMASSVTGSVIFRVVEAKAPVLLLDEADTYLREHAELRGTFNAGFSRVGGVVYRTNKDSMQPERFRCSAPLAIAGIGALPATVEDRGLPVLLQRKPKTTKLEKFRCGEREALRAGLRPRLAKWAQDYVPILKGGEPPPCRRG